MHRVAAHARTREAAAELLVPALTNGREHWGCYQTERGRSAAARLEVEDEADKWDPPGSDRSCGPLLSERGREE